MNKTAVEGWVNYWITPANKVIKLKRKETHTQWVLNNPTKISPIVKRAVKDFMDELEDEGLTLDSDVTDENFEIMNAMLKSRWVRVSKSTGVDVGMWYKSRLQQKLIDIIVYLLWQSTAIPPIFAINRNIFLHFSPVLLPSAQGVEDGKALHQKRISNHRLFNQSEAIHQANRPSRACKCSQGAHRRVDRLQSLRQPGRYGQNRGPARQALPPHCRRFPQSAWKPCPQTRFDRLD